MCSRSFPSTRSRQRDARKDPKASLVYLITPTKDYEVRCITFS